MLLNSAVETLGDLVEVNAGKFGSRTALVYDGRSFSYGEQRSRIYRLANALHRMGVRRQHRVAILAQNSNAYVEVYAAGEVAGFITVAINYRLAASEIEYIVKDSAPSVLIFDAEYAPTIANIRAKYPEIGHYIVIGEAKLDGAENYENLLARSSDHSPKTRSRPTDVAYLIYTSGTTGRPKGAMLDHAGQLGFIEMQAIEMSLRQTDTMLLVMPFYHIGAKCNYLMSSLVGANVILHRSYDIQSISADIERHKVTTIHLAPVMVKDLSGPSRLRQATLRVVAPHSICLGTDGGRAAAPGDCGVWADPRSDLRHDRVRPCDHSPSPSAHARRAARVGSPARFGGSGGAWLSRARGAAGRLRLRSGRARRNLGQGTGRHGGILEQSPGHVSTLSKTAG